MNKIIFYSPLFFILCLTHIVTTFKYYVTCGGILFFLAYLQFTSQQFLE